MEERIAISKRIRIFGILIISLLLVISIFFLVFRLVSLNFREMDLVKVYKTGFQEKTFVINNTIINYGEGPDNGPPLLLIHGQTVLWESYKRVLPELSENFHVFVPDCHGHGKSSRESERYNVENMGEDFIAFMEKVIKEPALVSGHSSGGLLSLWLGVNSPENVMGVVLEDPPFFSSEYPRIKQTFAWYQMELSHNFLNSSEEDFLDYWLLNSQVMSFFKGGQQGIYNWVQDFKRKRPGSPVQPFFLPQTMRMMFKGMMVYDPRFGDAFYDGSWHLNFDHGEALSKLNRPSVLIHTRFSFDENGILMAAMSGEDAARAHSLMGNSELVNVKSGHAVHIEKPDIFIRILTDFSQRIIGE